MNTNIIADFRYENDDTILLLQDIINYLYFQITNTKPLNILDLGSKDGYYYKYFEKEKLNHIIGIDKDIISDVYIDNELNMQIYKYDLNNIPYNFNNEILTEKFNLIVLMELLQYIYDPIYLLQYIYNVLAEKNTYIFITIPNTKNIDDLKSRFYEKFPLYDIDNIQISNNRWNNNMIRFYDMETIVKLITKVGFKIKHISGCNPFVSPIFTNLINNLSNNLQIKPEILGRLIAYNLYDLMPNIAILAYKE